MQTQRNIIKIFTFLKILQQQQFFFLVLSFFLIQKIDGNFVAWKMKHKKIKNKKNILLIHLHKHFISFFFLLCVLFYFLPCFLWEHQKGFAYRCGNSIRPSVVAKVLNLPENLFDLATDLLLFLLLFTQLS